MSCVLAPGRSLSSAVQQVPAVGLLDVEADVAQAGQQPLDHRVVELGAGDVLGERRADLVAVALVVDGRRGRRR